jgi:tetratricopeptide (TPR) repeat protein
MDMMRILGWILGAALVLLILGWSLRRSEEPLLLLLRWILTAVAVAGIWLLFGKFFKPSGRLDFGAAFLLGIASLVFGLFLAILWAPSLIRTLTSPLTRLFYDEGQPIEPKPLYSTALALRKKGHYEDALQAVRAQLAQFPDDLPGTLLQAEILAVDMGDPQRAEQILESFINRTDVPNAVVALNQIADWRLTLQEDTPGARAALTRIRTLCPGSEAAFMAEQRLARLSDENAIDAVQHPAAIPYVEFPRPARVGEVLDVRPKPLDPGQETAELVRHLNQHPEDYEARERLAMLYVDHFKRMDLARIEMEALIGNKRAPQRNIVAWLNRLADLELRGAHDVEAARLALQRIIDANPKVAAAEQARRRMMLLEREVKRYT